MRANRTLSATLLAAALLVGACAGAPGSDESSAARTDVSTSDRSASAPSSPTPDGGEPVDSAAGLAGEPAADGVVVAVASSDVTVYSDPGAGTVHTVLPATTGFGSPRTLLVAADHGDWLDVVLPTRPNGSRGFVSRADVQLQRVQYHVAVSLESRTLTVTAEDQVLLSTPVAVGTPENPTPAGLHYVTDVLDTPDDGAYGPFAIGLSAHSDTLSEFAGGDGQIGIHGTNDPSSIGNAVSHGCVRVPNDVIATLAATLPLGTPVVVHA